MTRKVSPKIHFLLDFNENHVKYMTFSSNIQKGSAKVFTPRTRFWREITHANTFHLNIVQAHRGDVWNYSLWIVRYILNYYLEPKSRLDNMYANAVILGEPHRNYSSYEAWMRSTTRITLVKGQYVTTEPTGQSLQSYCVDIMTDGCLYLKMKRPCRYSLYHLKCQ